MLEYQFQHIVIKLAEQAGCLVYHVSNVRGQLRNQTAVGFPDLIIVNKKVIAWECKRKGKKPSEEQVKWLDAFQQSGIEARVITEDDFGYVLKELGGKDMTLLERLELTLLSMKAGIEDIKRGK